MKVNVTVTVFFCISIAALGQKNPEYANSMAISPNGDKVATGDYTGKISIWSLPSFKLLLTFQAHADLKYKRYIGLVEEITFSPDGKTIASAGAYDVKLWDAATGKLIRILGEHERSIGSLCFSRKGEVLVSCGGGIADAKIWNVATGNLLYNFSREDFHVRSVTSSQFSPDDKILATTGGDAQVKFWNPVTRELIRSFQATKWDAIRGGKFSPDGKAYVTVCDEDGAKINIWEVATGKLLKSITARASLVSYSADGRFIITTNYDHILSVWSLETGQKMSSEMMGKHYLFAVSDSGNIIASGGNGFQLWSLDSSGKLKMTGEKTI
jgi:WD40 repeat protein